MTAQIAENFITNLRWVQRTGLAMLMSWDILTFIKLRGAKGQVLSCWKTLEKSATQNFESIVTENAEKAAQKCSNKDCHRKDWEKIPGSGGFWQEFKNCLASNRSWEGAGEMRERRQRVALCSPAGWQEEEERKGVAANSIISCCSVKPFVYSPLTPWLLYLRNTIKDCEGVARTVELFDTLSLFNWNTNPVGLCFFERKRVQRYESVNSCKRRPSDFGDQVWFWGHHGYAWQLREGGARYGVMNV